MQHIRPNVSKIDIFEDILTVEETVKALPESVQEASNPSPQPQSPILSKPLSSFIEKPLEESTQPKENFQNKQLRRANELSYFCMSQTPKLIGDKKIDEIIEYVHQNLEEAGKVLTTLLNQNIEHDLKNESHIQRRKTVSTSRGRKRRGYN